MRRALPALALVTACHAAAPAPAAPPLESTGGSEAAEKPILVVVLPVSGWESEHTRATLDGVMLAVERDGDAVDVVTFDSSHGVDSVVDGLRGLLHQRAAIAIIGDIDPSMATITDAPLISTGAEKVEAGFALQGTTFLEGVVAAKFAVTRGWKNAAIVMETRNPGLGFAFNHGMKRVGTVLGMLSLPQGTTNFAKQLAQLQQLAPDALYLPCARDKARPLLAQLAGAGISVPIIGPSYWGDLDGDQNAIGTFQVTPFAPDDPVSADFTRDFTDRYDATPDRWAAAGHDAATIALEVAAQDVALQELDTDELPLAMGPIGWKEAGGSARRRSLPVVQITANGPVFIDRISIR